MTDFPISAFKHTGENDQPRTTPVWGLQDARGYWANIGGYIFQMPVSDPQSRRTVETVAKMVNAAYEQGRIDKLREIQDVLQIERSQEP